MARNYQEAKKIRERLNADLDKYLGKGKDVKQLGFQMKEGGIPMGVGKGYLANKDKLKPSMTRQSYDET